MAHFKHRSTRTPSFEQLEKPGGVVCEEGLGLGFRAAVWGLGNTPQHVLQESPVVFCERFFFL